eukprot:scaffold15551_cov62-Phaeocystis_antarctica.AAC.2
MFGCGTTSSVVFVRQSKGCTHRPLRWLVRSNGGRCAHALGFQRVSTSSESTGRLARQPVVSGRLRTPAEDGSPTAPRYCCVYELVDNACVVLEVEIRLYITPTRRHARAHAVAMATRRRRAVLLLAPAGAPFAVCPLA